MVTASHGSSISGCHGTAPPVDGFSLCGWRNQSKGGNLLRYRFSPGDGAVVIENSADALDVSAPFPPSHSIAQLGFSAPFSPPCNAAQPCNMSLQERSGLYTFCVRWIPALRLFNFTYGITVTRMLHTDPAPEVQGLRGWVDEALSRVDFHGNSHYFGDGALKAAVYKLESSDVITSLPQHLGVTLALPNQLLERGPDGAARRLHVVRLEGRALFQVPPNSSLLNGLVLGVTLLGTKVSNLPEDINITFPHQPLQPVLSPLQEPGWPRCVFWNESSEEWSSAGCRTVPGELQTQCCCNHLTYFAVLMQTSSEVISENHLVWLTALTFAGCAISALACVFTIAWMCLSRKGQANPTLQIHMNLLGALLLLDISFVGSALLGALEDAALCRGAAMLLHFSLLGLFSWMAIEGFNLYRLVVKVFLSATITTAKLAVLAWGAPTLIVLIIFLVNAENYGIYHMRVERPSSHNATAAMCWLTEPFIHQLVNLGFFAAVLLFNMCMLVAMTMRVLRLSTRSRREKARHCVTLLGLSCMMGLTWGLAFFSFGNLYLPIQYAFTILNALQGLFIFLWYWALSQSHPRHSMRSSDFTSATPASPRADQTLSTDNNKLLS
ncbi:adhesion G-protein coupled receptor G1-like [Gastrophryne carolinensis]